MIKGLRILVIAALGALAIQVSAADDAQFWSKTVTSALTGFERAPKPHPRVFGGMADHSGIVAAATQERSPGFNHLTNYLRRTSAQNFSQRNKSLPGSLNSKEALNDWFKLERNLEGIAEAAFAWHVVRENWYLDEVRARLSEFGAIVQGNECKLEMTQSRAFAWYFAVAFDFAYAGLTTGERESFKKIVKQCVGAALPAAVRAVQSSPRDSIPFHTLGRLTGALTIMLGEFPEAQTWLAPALSLYMSELSPWGGADGGYANGSSYLLWDIGESLLAWDLFDRALGIPIYSKPWVASVPRFMAYVLPPGTPAGTFGDGAEVNRKEEWARFGKAIAARSQSPLARWYEKQLFGEDISRLHVLLAPRPPAGSASWPASEPSSAHFPSVGIAAMHSAMADRSRVSIYFKSAPFGSFNHSHADQNSFLIYAHGRVLAMDSGYYDRYNSPHWRDWYKQTKAHNAVTFDDGEGQSLGPLGLGSFNNNGRITRFHSTTEYDLVGGDATAAYDGKVKSAKRWLVFIKPATLLVLDQLEAAVPRLWEWNLHTPAPLLLSGNGYRMSADGTDLCVRVWSDAEIDLKTRNGYTPSPEISGALAPHVWNTFVLRRKSPTGIFVSVNRIDCAGPEPEVSFVNGLPSIKVANRVVTFTGTDVSVK